MHTQAYNTDATLEISKLVSIFGSMIVIIGDEIAKLVSNSAKDGPKPG